MRMPKTPLIVRLVGAAACSLAAWCIALPNAWAADPEPAPAPPPAAVPPPATAPAAVAEEKPPTSAEAMPATRPDVLPPIQVGAWLRTGVRIQDGNPKNLGGEKVDTLYGELHAGGKIHKNVSVTLNLNADGLHGTAGIEDAIVGFDVAEPFHVWIGQLLVPVDRANAAGPFFMIPWNYPGFLSVGGTTVVGAPAEGPNGRNGGAVVWGNFMEGAFKYFVGAFQTGTATTSPLFSGRLHLNLVGAEPGFWGNATYFGDKDIVAIGVGGQYQKGSGNADAYAEFNADALVEYRIGGGAWVTLDGAYYHFSNTNPVKDHFYVLGAIASGSLGGGNLQPMVRYQWAKTQSAIGPVQPDTATSAIDVGLSYILKGPALRLMATYQHTDLGQDMAGNDIIANSVQLGAQAIFF
jgi:hypothetical protein